MSYNYFFYTYRNVISIVIILIKILVAASIFFPLVHYYLKSEVKKPLLKAVGIVVIISVSSWSVSYLFDIITDDLINGEIKKVFIINENDNPKISVLFLRKEESTNYYRFRSYHLLEGTQIGKIDLIEEGNWLSKKFKLFPPKGRTAWTYSMKTGYQLIDLVSAKIIGSEKAIMKRNPIIGNKIIPLRSDTKYDYESQMIGIVNSKGQTIGIDTDLNARLIDTGLFREKENSYFERFCNHSRNRNRYPSCRDDVCWIFINEKDSVRKKLIGYPATYVIKDGYPLYTLKKRQISYNSKSFIKPRIINEINERCSTKPLVINKMNERCSACPDSMGAVWISHSSTIKMNSGVILSYVKGDGSVLKSYNMEMLTEYEEVPEIKGSFFVEDKIILFISQSGYTLTGIVTDVETGEIIRKIEYF